MKKIGIYTFWNVPNYGGFLQAYSLQKAIENYIEESDVLQFSYLDIAHYQAYYGLWPHGWKWLLNPSCIRDVLHRFINPSKRDVLMKFLQYYDTMIPHTKEKTLYEIENKEFDAIVLGSDIVWDYSIDFFNHDVHLFGNRLNSENIVSYAASFGTVTSETKVPQYVLDGLENMKAISVRDMNSVELVRQYTGREAEWVIDPTFLIDFDMDEHIQDPGLDDYIVVYGSNFTNELIAGAREYADVHRCKLICLDSFDDSFQWCDRHIAQDEMDPFKWCSYFKYAKAVFTCTYHGLMFGIIFRKPIIFNPTPFIMAKADYFIQYLGLKDVLVDKKSFVEKIMWDWDYDKIQLHIEELKNKSIAYLKESLN